MPILGSISRLTERTSISVFYSWTAFRIFALTPPGDGLSMVAFTTV